MGDAGPNASFTFTMPDRPYAGSVEAMEIVTNQPYGEKVSVPHDTYPLLVTFDDLSDPSTIKQVDPDNLAASFGPSVRLKSLTLERTRERVTDWPIEELLPCIEGTTQCIGVNRSIRYGHPMANILNSYFRRGG